MKKALITLGIAVSLVLGLSAIAVDAAAVSPTTMSVDNGGFFTFKPPVEVATFKPPVEVATFKPPVEAALSCSYDDCMYWCLVVWRGGFQDCHFTCNEDCDAN